MSSLPDGQPGHQSRTNRGAGCRTERGSRQRL